MSCGFWVLGCGLNIHLIDNKLPILKTYCNPNRYKFKYPQLITHNPEPTP